MQRVRYFLPAHIRRVFAPRANKPLVWIQYIFYGSIVLYLGRVIFIPLSYALLISFVLHPVCSALERKGINRGPAIFISLFLLTAFIIGIILLMISQFSSFLKEWPLIQQKIQQLISDVSHFAIDKYAISKEQQQKWVQEALSRSFGQVASIARQAITSSIYSAVILFLVPIYAALILYYRHQLFRFIIVLFPHEKKEDTRQLLTLTIGTYYNFIKGVAIVYFIVGVLNSLGLLIIGVPHAIFFGFVTSVLTFVPYIGIIIGSLLPIAMAWITYGSIWYPLGVVAVFAFVQYVEANVIFPLAVSNRLNINPLATLIAIMAGGIIWGVSGMILFVPFLAILKLVAERHASMKAVLTLTAGSNAH